ncbi:MAG: ribonuclease T2 [Smithella sp.]
MVNKNRAVRERGMITKNILIFSTLVLFILVSTAFAKDQGYKKSSTGKFDSYVLALSWQPAFCETKPDKKECKTQTPDRYDATNLALHGLWPNKNTDKKQTFGFCGVKKSIRKLDTANKWCKMPSLNLTDETKKDLTQSMPGYASCLERHEWYKHGTCSGMKADKYFSTSNLLVATFAATAMGQYIAANVGSIIDADDLFKEFEKDFGEGSRDSLKLHCTKLEGVNLLVEVRVYLANPIPAGGELKDLLVSPPAHEKGSCPQTFFIDEAGLSGAPNM